MPGVEGSLVSGTVSIGSQAMAMELDMVVDAALGGQEAPRVAG